MLLMRLRSRTATKQEFPPCKLRALDAREKGGGHGAEVSCVNVIYQHPPRNRGAEQQQPQAVGGAHGIASGHGMEDPIGELSFPLVEALLAIAAQQMQLKPVLNAGIGLLP